MSKKLLEYCVVVMFMCLFMSGCMLLVLHCMKKEEREYNKHIEMEKKDNQPEPMEFEIHIRYVSPKSSPTSQTKTLEIPVKKSSLDLDSDKADVMVEEFTPDGSEVPEKIIDVIKRMELFYDHTYYDAAGVLTIGYGFTRDCVKSLQDGDTMTREEADAKLVNLINKVYIPLIRETVKVNLTSYQLGSLVSLLHNIGENAFKRSTLVYLLNKGEYNKAADEFDEWVKIKGKVCRGLIKRRSVEKQIFLAMYRYEKGDIYK